MVLHPLLGVFFFLHEALISLTMTEFFFPRKTTSIVFLFLRTFCCNFQSFQSNIISENSNGTGPLFNTLLYTVINYLEYPGQRVDIYIWQTILCSLVLNLSVFSAVIASICSSVNHAYSHFQFWCLPLVLFLGFSLLRPQYRMKWKLTRT